VRRSKVRGARAPSALAAFMDARTSRAAAPVRRPVRWRRVHYRPIRREGKPLRRAPGSEGARRVQLAQEAGGAGDVAAQHLVAALGLGVAAPALDLEQFEIERWGSEDRKSTRLNSSHVKISYAVFC